MAFVRVRDRNTGDQYDVEERAVRPDAHERLDRPQSSRPRRSKQNTPKGRPGPTKPAEADNPKGTS